MAENKNFTVECLKTLLSWSSRSFFQYTRSRSPVWVHVHSVHGRILRNSRGFRRYVSTRLTVKGFKGTIVNRALSSLHGGSREITLTVPLWNIYSDIVSWQNQVSFYIWKNPQEINEIKWHYIKRRKQYKSRKNRKVAKVQINEWNEKCHLNYNCYFGSQCYKIFGQTFSLYYYYYYY